jgi:hypothetical protein
MQPHRADIVSLVFGLAFAGLGLAFLISPVGALDLPWEWVAPIMITTVGAAILAGVLRRGDHRELDDDRHDELAGP